MAFSWKTSKIKAKKHLKYRILILEKQGNNITATKQKQRLTWMEKQHDV